MPDVADAPPILRLEETFTKVALFGGVYNNHLALQAACEAAEQRGCEALFQLGDLGGFGPNPDKVFPVLRAHNVRCIQGNYEESLASRNADCGCGYTHPRDNHFAQISYDYTDRKLSEENRRWLAQFPKQIQFRCGNRVVHLCHGSPRRVNEFLWETTTADAFVRRTARDLGCDVLACTHTGLPWTRDAGGGVRIVNVGVLGRPANNGRTEVGYAELAWTGDDLRVEFVPVAYDWKALAAEMAEENLPPEFIETITTGWWTTCLEILPGKERARGRH